MTTKDFNNQDVKFIFKLEEEVKTEIYVDQCRIILHDEIYTSQEGVTRLFVSIRGYNKLKMPGKFQVKKIWNYFWTIDAMIAGFALMGAGEALTVFSWGSLTPATGVMITTGFTMVLKNGSDLSSYITNDFFMPAGMGLGDEGDFLKVGFEKGFGEKGEDYYNDFVLGMTVMTVYYDLRGLKAMKDKDVFIDEKTGKQIDNKELGKIKEIVDNGNGKNITARYKDKKRRRICLYGERSRVLDYFGTLKNMYKSKKDTTGLINDINDGRVFITDTYLEKVTSEKERKK